MKNRQLHVIRTLNPEEGGVAEVVKQLTAAADRLGQSSEIVTLDAPDSAWLNGFACTIHSLGPARFTYGYAPLYNRWLASNAQRFDSVLVHGIWQYPSLATWQVLRSSKIPYFVFTHGMLDPWFKRQYPLKHLKKLLYWPWAEYRVLRDARAVLFTAEEEKELARQSFGLYRANEVVVNCGTPGLGGDPLSQREHFLSRFPHLRGKRIILFLGRIHPKKGCDLLIEAFASVRALDPSLHLVMAGPDQTGIQSTLRALAQRHGAATAITWTGMLTGESKNGAFRAGEVFILPSHQENFGIAVAEALSCGLPVLISNKVNIWREILADDAGLVAEDTLQGTEDLLRKWLALDVDRRAAMAKHASQSFVRRFHIDAAAARLQGAIQECSGTRHGSIAA
jgi:glycosyltransferase involved in cell wall biosynthesis